MATAAGLDVDCVYHLHENLVLTANGLTRRNALALSALMVNFAKLSLVNPFLSLAAALNVFLSFIKVGKEWGEWSEWSDCTKSCGMGTRLRQRECSGQRCLGRAKENMQCNTICQDGLSWLNEIYSKGIFYLPNAVALGTAVFLICVTIILAIYNCRR